MLPSAVEIVEVGPREGFQYEGVGRPDAIKFSDKLRLIEALSYTGITTLQVASFVHPKQVPQMADAERICEALPEQSPIRFTGIYLNEVGLRRALAAQKLTIVPELVLTASETFALKNQRRTLVEDVKAQRKMIDAYREQNLTVQCGSIMAAFGCNYEGDIPLSRVLDLVITLHDLAEESGGQLHNLMLADTMGWANPQKIQRMIAAVREKWPRLGVRLHLHDTRGLGLANVYSALEEGIASFDTAVGGLGGCPFAGHGGAAGNVCTEEVAFLCQELGIKTGINLDSLIDCARLAEAIVGHPLPSKLIRSNLRRKCRADSVS
jgi:hydroxymethylglutaryl-CoA lyase